MPSSPTPCPEQPSTEHRELVAWYDWLPWCEWRLGPQLAATRLVAEEFAAIVDAAAAD